MKILLHSYIISMIPWAIDTSLALGTQTKTSQIMDRVQLMADSWQISTRHQNA
jgi:hypothetical protein